DPSENPDEPGRDPVRRRAEGTPTASAPDPRSTDWEESMRSALDSFLSEDSPDSPPSPGQPPRASDVEPSWAERSWSEPSRSEPSRPEPSRSEPSRPEPSARSLEGFPALFERTASSPEPLFHAEPEP